MAFFRRKKISWGIFAPSLESPVLGSPVRYGPFRTKKIAISLQRKKYPKGTIIHKNGKYYYIYEKRLRLRSFI